MHNYSYIYMYIYIYSLLYTISGWFFHLPSQVCIFSVWLRWLIPCFLHSGVFFYHKSNMAGKSLNEMELSFAGKTICRWFFIAMIHYRTVAILVLECIGSNYSFWGSYSVYVRFCKYWERFFCGISSVGWISKGSFLLWVHPSQKQKSLRANRLLMMRALVHGMNVTPSLTRNHA